MRIGVTLPNHWGVEDVREVLALAPHAESLGYESVWTADHLLNVGRIRERLGDRPYWHPLAILSYVAATTSRVRLGTSVMVLPYHDPVGLAKYAATLDHMSRGRFVLGVGVGALREEFDALGVPARRRGALTDEAIAVIEDLWSSPEPSYHGGRFAFERVAFSPRPYSKPRLPLWIGGSSEPALARTARHGDGWHPSSIAPGEYAAGRARVRELAEAAGRDPDAIEMSIRLNVDTTEALDEARLDRLESDLAAYRDAGATHAMLALTSGDVARLRAWMEAIAGRLIVPPNRQFSDAS